MKKAQAHNSATFDPLDVQNFTYTYDTNDDFEAVNKPQQDENVMGADLPQEFQRNTKIKKGPYTPEFLSSLQRSLRDVTL